MCDEHPDRPATRRIQGETDSFGAEFHDLCADCATAFFTRIAAERERPHRCDWCKAMATDTRPHRDFEEGFYGPVYIVCAACQARESESLAKELAERDDWSC